MHSHQIGTLESRYFVICLFLATTTIMSTSILDIASCSFAKGILFELFTSSVGIERMLGEPQVMYASRLHNQRYIQYSEILGDCYYVPYKTFVDKFPKITERLDLWGKRYSDKKAEFLRKYNWEQWGKISHDEQSRHKLFECEACRSDQSLKQLLCTYPLNR